MTPRSSTSTASTCSAPACACSSPPAAAPLTSRAPRPGPAETAAPGADALRAESELSRSTGAPAQPSWSRRPCPRRSPRRCRRADQRRPGRPHAVPPARACRLCPLARGACAGRPGDGDRRSPGAAAPPSTPRAPGGHRARRGRRHAPRTRGRAARPRRERQGHGGRPRSRMLARSRAFAVDAGGDIRMGGTDPAPRAVPIEHPLPVSPPTSSSEPAPPSPPAACARASGAPPRATRTTSSTRRAARPRGPA